MSKNKMLTGKIFKYNFVILDYHMYYPSDLQKIVNFFLVPFGLQVGATSNSVENQETKLKGKY